MALSPSPVTADATDEEIIELTDIVEKGTVPPELSTSPDAGASGASPQPEGDAGHELENQMADLFSPSAAGAAAEDEAFDLDALLGQMEGEGSAPQAAPITPDPASDVAEPACAQATPDLADVGLDDVDALLRDLVAPEQPESAGDAPAAPAQSNGPGGDDGFGDLDSLLADLDGVTEAAAPAGAGDAAGVAAPSVAATTTAPADASFAEVLAAASGEADAGAPVPDPGAKEDEVEELDALLDSIMNPDSVSLSSAGGNASAADPAEEDDMPDLDALLAAAEADQQALEHAPASADPALMDAAVSADVPAEGSADRADAVVPDLPIDSPPDISPNIPPNVPPNIPGETPAAANTTDPLPETPLQTSAATQQRDNGGEAAAMLGALAADIAALRTSVEQNTAKPDSAVYASLQEKVERLQAEVEDMAETHAAGLASAEARISTLEAELAERDAAMAAGGGSDAALAARLDAVEAALAGSGPDAAPGGDSLELASGMVNLEDRLSALEARVSDLDTRVEKAASEAAARVIREEIAALLADMGDDAGQA